MEVNILVTGGAGFIGSCLVERLLRNANYRVVIADKLQILIGNSFSAMSMTIRA